ncbi:MAG: hypothetical protein PHE61_02015 [Candidatus Omnitrophica bacterium]|nr:hypothetical protein [Candidatus Omnitrophota bacterium]
MKKVLVVIICVAVALVLLSSAKDIIVKVSVEKGTELVTGLRLGIKSMHVGIIRTVVSIKDLRLFNPEGYPEKAMLDAPEVYVAYDLPAVFKSKVHLTEMRFNLKELTVIKNKNGELNLNSLKMAKKEKPQKGTAKEPAKTKEKAAKKEKAMEIQIDNLELKIGKVVYKDYSKDGVPEVKEFNVNLDERYKNIKDMRMLTSLIIFSALKNTAVAQLTGFDAGELKANAQEALSSAKEMARESAGTMKKAAAETKVVAKEVGRDVKAGAQKVGSAVKGLFGGNKGE